MDNNTMWAWGYNGEGRLGDGTTVNSREPVRIGGAYSWSSVAAGATFSFGIRVDGSLWAWGSNNHGQLGDGTTTSRSTPVQVQFSGLTGNSWTSVSGSLYNGMALRNTGELWVWGRNNHGQLGGGAASGGAYAPRQVAHPGGGRWVFAEAGGNTMFAIDNYGHLYTWGEAAGNSPARVTVAGAPNISWRSVSAGTSASYVLALTQDGRLFSWGSNEFGQLGRPTQANADPLPGEVLPGSLWYDARASRFAGLATRVDNGNMDEDGRLWTWGCNAQGTAAQANPAIIGIQATPARNPYGPDYR